MTSFMIHTFSCPSQTTLSSLLCLHLTDTLRTLHQYSLCWYFMYIFNNKKIFYTYFRTVLFWMALCCIGNQCFDDTLGQLLTTCVMSSTGIRHNLHLQVHLETPRDSPSLLLVKHLVANLLFLNCKCLTSEVWYDVAVMCLRRASLCSKAD